MYKAVKFFQRRLKNANVDKFMDFQIKGSKNIDKFVRHKMYFGEQLNIFYVKRLKAMSYAKKCAA